MAFSVQHVHLKTPDPHKTAQFYVDNFGAKLKADIPAAACRSICTVCSSTSPR